MNWFGNNNSDESDAHKSAIEGRDKQIKDLQQKIIDTQHQNTLDKETVENDHKLELKEKEFELKHLADEKVKTAEDKSTKLEQELAVAKKEIEMLTKITDLNADVIDVKRLVEALINKLPDVKITGGLPGTTPAKLDKPEKGADKPQQ